ncbi:MAG: DUF1499 domain-containing protein [Elusimicrobia bacterium]|nr:DUF1499 domain-containing protein [Elusimicrobiota bacterium]
MINDVTTTPLEPPAYVRLAELPENKGRDMAYPPANAEVQTLSYPDLSPLPLAEKPEACFARAAAAARAMPRWQVVSEDAAGGRVEAVAVTGLLRFKDDVVVEVRVAAVGCGVHMRSKSRVGRGDFGANARRIRAFFQRLSSS